MDYVFDHKSVQDDVIRLHGRRQDICEGDLLHRLDRFNFFVKKMISISSIDLGEFDFDQERVDHFKFLFSQSGAYPPIVFDSLDGSIIDGIHRANALAQLGVNEIEAFVGVKEHEFIHWMRDADEDTDFQANVDCE